MVISGLVHRGPDSASGKANLPIQATDIPLSRNVTGAPEIAASSSFTWRSQDLGEILSPHCMQNRYLQLGIEVGGDIRIRHACYSKITAPSVNQNI